MAKTTDFELPNFRELMEAHMKDDGKDKKPRLELMSDELTCHVYVNATQAVLAVLGEKPESILHMNDRMQVKDFPHDGEILEELSDMVDFPVTDETFIWQIAKTLSTGESAQHKARSH